MAITRHITHIKSKVVENSNPKLPASGDIELGEIAVNYAKGYETISIKNESGDVVTFSEDKNIGKKGKLTGYAKASSVSAVATGDTINTAIGKLEKALDGKQASGSYLTGTTKYAGSSSQGGAATSANKINTDAGNTTTPVYFSGGVPVALSYTIAKSVPDNAVFTDTATTLNGHFAPTATTANTKTSSASGGNALAWSSSIVTGVTLSGDAKGHITAVAVSSAKLPANPNTDSATTLNGHYTPASSTTIAKTASSTTNATWGSSDFVTGVTLYKDAKGHITDMAVSSLQLPTPVTGVTLASGTNNGTLKLTVNGSPTDNISVKGINSMAYQATSSYSSATQVNTALANKLDKTEYATFSAATNTSIEDLSGQSETIAAALNNLNVSKLNASDVSAWAKASTKPSYIASEVVSIFLLSIATSRSSTCTITGSNNDGRAETIIYLNSGSSDLTVTVPTNYKTPDGEAIELTCPVGGYCEVSYLNINGFIYARGL